ncbi:MAG TPA: RtcB family protein [Nocardioides sp.]
MQQITKKFFNWASILEDNTRDQAARTSEMPFIYPHLALMPDAHLGMGATVGSVIPTLGAIMPAAVGVDIGCGMIAKRTQYTIHDLPARDQYADLRTAIENVIPLSKGGYNEREHAGYTTDRLDALARKATDLGFDPASFAGNWRLQLGTLGSGNHFIEVSLDQDDRVWLFLHSGSRGVGNQIAQHHIKVAKKLMARYWITLPDPDLSYLVEGTDEFWAYIRQMRWAQDFAYENRAEMMDRVTDAFESWMTSHYDRPCRVEPDHLVNCHHNYTTQEKHFGKDVWLSRKGAIDASAGTWGLIPGSMGTRSYVVQGRGNRLSLNSSPHGAGREYSRTAARKKFSYEDLQAAMGDIEYRQTDAFIDEIPAAYKPIDVVMEDAKDLVEVRYELRQILNVKGD